MACQVEMDGGRYTGHCALLTKPQPPFEMQFTLTLAPLSLPSKCTHWICFPSESFILQHNAILTSWCILLIIWFLSEFWKVHYYFRFSALCLKSALQTLRLTILHTTACETQVSICKLNVLSFGPLTSYLRPTAHCLWEGQIKNYDSQQEVLSSGCRNALC